AVPGTARAWLAILTAARLQNAGLAQYVQHGVFIKCRILARSRLFRRGVPPEMAAAYLVAVGRMAVLFITAANLMGHLAPASRPAGAGAGDRRDRRLVAGRRHRRHPQQ